MASGADRLRGAGEVMSVLAETIERMDRLARAGVNYALVVVGLSIVVATLTLLAADTVTHLSTARAIALIAGGGSLAAVGAFLQNRTELAVKREMVAANETELTASNRRLEITQMVLIEQLRQWSQMSELERTAVANRTNQLFDNLTSSTLWPASPPDADPIVPIPPGAQPNER